MNTRQTGGKALTEAALDYLNAHSTEKFSLEKLAGALFVNGSYLMRTFKRQTGITPLAYHQAVRCKNARELLTATDLSISKIGETVGFVSSSHFTHVFRKIEGCTPSEYRKRHASAGQEETEP